MHTNVRSFVDHLQAKLRTEGHTAYWNEAWSVIEALPIYATGDNYCFQVRRFDEMVDSPERRLFALPAREFEGHWEVISFAQTALEGMSGNETIEEFSAALRAARVEIVKSKMFCIANHLYWAASSSTPNDPRALNKWLRSISDQRIGYADESYYDLLPEPPTTISRGTRSG
jgi:hypothetical protein